MQIKVLVPAPSKMFGSGAPSSGSPGLFGKSEESIKYVTKYLRVCMQSAIIGGKKFPSLWQTAVLFPEISNNGLVQRKVISSPSKNVLGKGWLLSAPLAPEGRLRHTVKLLSCSENSSGLQK